MVTNLIAFRDVTNPSWPMHIAKIVALGYDCDLDATWVTPAEKQFTFVGEFQTFSGPFYENCQGPKTGADLNFEFYDLNGGQMG